MLHALGVLVRAEDVDGLVIGRAVGFHAFVALLAVVQAGRHAVDAEEGGFDERWLGPLAGLLGVGTFDVAVDWEGVMRESCYV